MDTRNLTRAISFRLAAALSLVWTARIMAEDPDYGRDVRPILSQFCFKCHGPDETRREAGLRLDQSDEATKPAGSGERPIVPTEPDASELIRRINSADPDQHMPPPSTKLQLSDAQKNTLRRWIASGAKYRPHWSFVPPQRPAVPAVKQSAWPRGGLDSFVLSRLETEHLSPSDDADRYTLIRRVSLDLVGLPPSPDEVDEFVGDSAPDAYERLIDRLLASPRYGERWARRWLDLARYADTNGYEKDRSRSVWPYRDWVIKGLNANMPFDQFTIEQLAGDMLPDATQDQRIATGFHRNTMLNEEGGIDPLEFRFYAMTDRVATTATVWMGLTLGCAQCHTHKYDPITHRDYYGFFALLNNADEPEIDVVQPDITARRAAQQLQIDKLIADLPKQFPLPDEFTWTAVKPAKATSANGATLEVAEDGSVLATGTTPETDAYQLQFDSELTDIIAIRLEALSDPRLPNKGPGRTPHGNFVLSEISATIEKPDGGIQPQALKFSHATADFSQDMFPVQKAIDGDTKASGWAIHGPGEWNVNRTATFVLQQPVAEKSRWTIRLEHQFGKQHTLGKFRVSLGRRSPVDSGSEEDRRRTHFERKFGAWLKREQDRVVKWTRLTPASAKSNLPMLTIENDDSIIVSGDMSKFDIYDISFAPASSSASTAGWTAIRIEALADSRLPKGGPGRVYYEGPFGDFFLSEVTVRAEGQPVKLTGATQSFANGNNTAAMALDGNQQTGWSINGGQGKTHVAVFRFEKPVARTSRFDLSLLFERYYAAGLGRFRISVTDDAGPVEASPLPIELESTVLASRNSTTSFDDSRSLASRHSSLLAYFCEVAPELASQRQVIAELRTKLPAYPSTLAMRERPADNPRLTRRHHRGEFLQPKEVIQGGMLSALPPLPKGQPADRLALARWLVSTANPLGGRVTVNREWMTFFGRGLVRTVEDFGSQGASPTHSTLLDWLAVELTGTNDKPLPDGQRWDMKRLHRQIVTSSTYRQSSRMSPELLSRDPQNELLARGPRSRLEAEILRDAALSTSGLLSEKMLGPSVFPVQPPSVTTEGAYGGLSWTVSPGEDRYRRTLYTFSKRTAPFAMSLTFDAPSGEACVARREVTNTPLQALTLLNDSVFVEAAQALGREFANRQGTIDDRLTLLFRRSVTRPPGDEELGLLKRFYEQQLLRLQSKELDAKSLNGSDADIDRAAWTIVARSILNLDEAVTKN